MKQLNMLHLPAEQKSWLEATFARNRDRYGDLRMEAPAPPPAPPAPAVVPTVVPAVPANPVVAPVVAQPSSWETNPGAGGKDAVLADLARARAEAKAAADARDALQAEKDARDTAALSELDQAKKREAEATARAEKAERTALVTEVALAKSLPPALAARLTGATKAELEADADSLLALIPPAGPRQPAPDPSQGGGDGSKLTGAARGEARWQEKHGKKDRPSR